MFGLFFSIDILGREGASGASSILITNGLSIAGAMSLPGPGAGAQKNCRGHGPAGAGAKKICRGHGPAGAGALKFCRGFGPAGAGA